MRGTVRFRDGAWRLQVYAGRDATGKRRQIARTVHAPNTRAGRREAESQLARLVVEVNAGHARPSDSMTVEELLARWVAHRAPTWSPKTRQDNERNIRLHLVPFIGATRVDRLRPIDVAHLHTTLHADGRGTPTVRRAHIILHAAYVQAVRWGIVATNPARKEVVDAPSAQQLPAAAPDPAMVNAALADAADDPTWSLALRLAATTGARRGQLSALRWSDVDLETGEITWARAMVLVEHGGLVEKSTKTGRPVVTAVDPETVERLRSWRATQAELGLAAGVRVAGDGFVLSRSVGAAEPMRPDYLTHRWVKTRARLGLPGDLRLHDLRHHMATQLLAAGVDVRTVAERLGHARPAVTLNVYAHHIPARDHEAAAIMARVVAGE